MQACPLSCAMSVDQFLQYANIKEHIVWQIEHYNNNDIDKAEILQWNGSYHSKELKLMSRWTKMLLNSNSKN